jgi:hypothetical protein
LYSKKNNNSIVKINRIFIILIIAAFPEFVHTFELKKFQARPDQVLVIYNEDWEKDVDMSAPGQDSKEVAEYYIKKHAETSKGLKPYSLGLNCRHRKKHLNHWYIKEPSQDNKNGIVFKGEGIPPKRNEWVRDSRKVEIVVENKDDNVDWDSIESWCYSFQLEKKIRVMPTVSGIPITQKSKLTYPPKEDGKGRCFRFNAHELFSGTVLVTFKAKDKNSKIIQDLKLKYYDRDDFVFSMTGKDRIIDEKNFQEDIAIPIKRFLEDPQNSLPDGTLLKDHILYIVICHGLPFSVEGVFGIARGVTSNPANHGDLGSIEQRLQTLYYGWGTKIKPPVVSRYMKGGPDSKKGVRNYLITSAMRYPMYGKRWNIYMHPDTYSYLKPQKNAIGNYDLPPFPEIRKRAPDYFFGYGATRIDGQGPNEAKRIIDYSLYATKYLRPEMIQAHSPSEAEEADRSVKKHKVKNIFKGKNWGWKKLPELGFEKIPGQNSKGIPFLKFNPDLSRNRFRYLPGGMDRVVDSANGWNGNRDQPIWKQVEQGVTVSACGGPAYGGGPHITNATFWDNRILMRYLFRGRDLGECFLLSTVYVNWSTSLLGDPLYHPDLSKTIVDRNPPSVQSEDDIQVTLYPTMGKQSAVISVPVQFSKDNPEVAILEAYFQKEGEKNEQAVSSSIFSARPKVVLKGLAANNVYNVRLVLTDPYGNKTDLSKQFGYLPVSVEGFGGKMPTQRQALKRNNSWVFEFLRMKKLSEQGTIQIQFEAGKYGLFPSIKAANMNFRAKNYGPKGRSAFSFQLGGAKRGGTITSVLEQGEKATIIIRWRRYPLTREVLLRAEDGTEFTLVADVRTPWENMEAPRSIKILEREEVKILSASIIEDAEAASDGAMGIELLPLNKEIWGKARDQSR